VISFEPCLPTRHMMCLLSVGAFPLGRRKSHSSGPLAVL